jgi:hypothetical protein
MATVYLWHDYPLEFFSAFDIGVCYRTPQMSTDNGVNGYMNSHGIFGTTTNKAQPLSGYAVDALRLEEVRIISLLQNTHPAEQNKKQAYDSWHMPISRLKVNVTDDGKQNIESIIHSSLSDGTSREAKDRILAFYRQSKKHTEQRNLLLGFYRTIIIGDNLESTDALTYFVRLFPLHRRENPKQQSYNDRNAGIRTADKLAKENYLQERSDQIACFIIAMIDCDAVHSLELFMPKFRQHAYPKEVESLYKQLLPEIIDTGKCNVLVSMLKGTDYADTMVLDENRSMLCFALSRLFTNVLNFSKLLKQFKTHYHDFKNDEERSAEHQARSSVETCLRQYLANNNSIIQYLLTACREVPEEARRAAADKIKMFSNEAEVMPDIRAEIERSLRLITEAPGKNAAVVAFNQATEWATDTILSMTKIFI